MRIPPASAAFTLLLGFLVALPSFGIDISLPALTATGAALRVAPAQAGMMMSLFMLGFAVAPLFYGPASDRYGRKPVALFACILFIMAAIGCALAQSLPILLIWRVVQGAGAGASMTLALAIVRDLFEGQAARTKLSYVAITTMIVPTIAPSAGAALLAFVISLLILGTVAFGLIAPNAMQGAMQPLPEIAGAAGAATGCIQMTMGAVASALVAVLYDGHSALSMTALMALFSLLALVSYLLLARPAECPVVSS